MPRAATDLWGSLLRGTLMPQQGVASGHKEVGWQEDIRKDVRGVARVMELACGNPSIRLHSNPNCLTEALFSDSCRSATAIG